MVFLIIALLYQDNVEVFRPFELTEIEVTENYIYVAPFEINAILQYDLDGNFIRAFGRKGQGPGEFNFVSLAGKSQDHVFAVSVLNPSHVNEFSESGTLLRSIIVPEMVPFWPRRVTNGWLLTKKGNGTTDFSISDDNFESEELLISLAYQPAPNPANVRFRKILWSISRDKTTFFLNKVGTETIHIWNFQSGTHLQVAYEADKIPTPDGEKSFFGTRETLPPFKNFQPGPANFCLVYKALHFIHSDRPPMVIDPQGKQIDLKLSTPVWQRLLEIRGDWAWITTFDETTGAGILRIKLALLNQFIQANPISFSESDMNQYRKSQYR